MPQHKPTEEQQAIIDSASSSTSSIMVDAGAGCTKTTTLEMAAPEVPEQRVLGVAFNVKTKKEMESRLPKNFTIKTMNGLGHSAFGKSIGKRLILEEKKFSILLKELLLEHKISLKDNEWSEVIALANEARKQGLIPDHFQGKGLLQDNEENWNDLALECFADASLYPLARELLINSIKQGFQGIIDYDDQIYLSSLFSGVFEKYPLVLVDEYQDLNILNILQVKKSSSGRLIVLGDQRQSIYSFRGASANARNDFRALKSDWTDLPLMTTFRCPKVVVARQLHHVPAFRAAPGNKEGQFISLAGQEWNWKKIQELSQGQGTITILCRNNAPLLSMAMKLIKAKIGCQILGGALGKNLIALAKKIIKNPNLDITNSLFLINQWQDDQVKKLRAGGKEEKIAAVVDRAECLIAIAEEPSVQKAQHLFDLLERLFSQTSNLIKLSTIHKFKGSEDDIILHLDFFRIPSKWALSAHRAGSPKALIQEKNLLYVGETRTKNILINAELENFV